MKELKPETAGNTPEYEQFRFRLAERGYEPENGFEDSFIAEMLEVFGVAAPSQEAALKKDCTRCRTQSAMLYRNGANAGLKYWHFDDAGVTGICSAKNVREPWQDEAYAEPAPSTSTTKELVQYFCDNCDPSQPCLECENRNRAERSHLAEPAPSPATKCPTCGSTKRQRDTGISYCCKDSFHDAPSPATKDTPRVSDISMHDVMFLREALRKYGRHLTGCAAVSDLLADEEVACDCGFGQIEVRL